MNIVKLKSDEQRFARRKCDQVKDFQVCHGVSSYFIGAAVAVAAVIFCAAIVIGAEMVRLGLVVSPPSSL